MPVTQRVSIGEQPFDESLQEYLKASQQDITDVKADTQWIIDFLVSRFNELDFEAVMSNFLQKELLNDLCVNISQAGHSRDEEDISLATVFVELPVANEYSSDPPKEAFDSGRLPPGIITKVLSLAEAHLDPESLSLIEDLQGDKQSIFSDKRKSGRLVLIGGPGQGKTTVSQFICQLYRAAILKDIRKGHVLEFKVRQALNDIEEVCHQEGIELPSIPRIPFRITLSDFAAKLAAEHAPVNSILSYIAERIQTRTNQDLTVNHLRKWLAQYPWLLILDGLDEVPVSSNRDAVLATVNDFWIDATEYKADVMAIATTRPQGYNKDFSPDIYQHKWLVPLSTVRAKHYAERLTKVLYKQDEDRRKRILERLQNALDDEATARLMRSPLQVTIMANLVERIGKPPQERWSLFQKYYGVIYQRETERNISAATILRNYEPDINAIHHRVGLLLQIESEHSGRTGARLSQERFADLVEMRLREEGHDGKELLMLKNQIIEAAVNRLVFLVGVESDEIGFEIRSFQEFMAAEGLMAGSDDLVQRRMWEIASISNWRNVFLFAAGKCFFDRQHLREAIRGICIELNESTRPEDEATHVTLAGSQLALDLLEDGLARTQPGYAQSLARLALRLLDQPLPNYHPELADVYDPRLEYVYIEEIERRLQGNSSSQASVWRVLIRLVGRNVAWAHDFIERCWPSDIDQQLILFDIACNSNVQSLINTKLDTILPYASPFDLGLNIRRHMQSQHFIKDKSSVLRQILEQLIETLYSIKRHTMIPLWLSDTNKLDEAFRICLFTNSDYDWLIPLKDIPLPSPNWAPLMALARFVANPSKTTLAQELRFLAEYWSLLSRNEMPPIAPWPLASLLGIASNSVELINLADRVEGGEYGDKDVWMSAESRWLNDGVTLDDLSYMIDTHWPFDQHIGSSGFPIAGNFSYEIYREEESAIRLLMDSMNHIRKSRLDAEIAKSLYVAILLRTIGAFHAELRLTFDQFQAIEQNLPDDYGLYLNIFAIRDISSTNRDEYFDYIDQLGRTRDWLPFFSSPDNLKPQVETYANAFIEHPERSGLLEPLSVFAQEGSTSSIPTYLLDPKRHSDLRFQLAALIIRIAQSDWDPREAQELAKYSAEFITNEPGICEKIMRVVTANNLNGPNVEAFLLELRRLLVTAKSESIDQVILALDNSLRHRTTHLRERWSDLGLPKGLHTLIQV